MRPRAKGKLKLRANVWKKPEWVCIGVDISPSSIALAGCAYDSTLKKMIPPQTYTRRWAREEDYFFRMAELARAHNFIHSIVGQLRVTPDIDDIYIAFEEPWALWAARRGVSNSLKQQAQISGSFFGGLARYGYKNLHEISTDWWRKLVADDLGITTHHTKWLSKKIAKKYNCKIENSGKWRSKQWAIKTYGVPDLPDLIYKTKVGLTPRPEDSRAYAVQPEDLYDALAIMRWMQLQIKA